MALQALHAAGAKAPFHLETSKVSLLSCIVAGSQVQGTAKPTQLLMLGTE